MGSFPDYLQGNPDSPRSNNLGRLTTGCKSPTFRLSEDFVTNSAAACYGRMVLRGERVEAVPLVRVCSGVVKE